jgi:hypothetical protein
VRNLVFLIPILALCIPLLAVFVRSNIGLAIADAIRHNSGASAGAGARELDQVRGELDQLRVELDDLHGQLAETHERLDFAERMLARPVDAQRAPGLPQ